ncbi:SPOR domain-containing protein [uncultured Sphingomonas sp.]|uniref:tetratricopeptide repeat protein n=1 Tax=uncultured Sphingomonas sp. TaxID=158754 RepID=UPI0025D7BCA2|nr:SPOR domain-containing protein [uncultured Sphingomonas sp.]
MTKRNLIAAALLTSVTLAGGIAATASIDTGNPKRAASEAKTARRALDKRNADKAIAKAEAAVALDPRNAGYRTLLGQAYLTAGRFPSAVSALTDALALDPADGTAALHLALAQIATGQWDAARATLTTHDGIPAKDRGLAFALAGDPGTAVTVLTQAARAPDADAKTRQNLALSLALAGRWNEAKAVASFDMSPADVDQRMAQWAAFATPSGAADQVAALLGVVPVEDGGQPTRLALSTTSPNMVAVAQAVPTAESLPQPPVTDAAPQVAETKPAPAVGKADVANIGAAPVTFAPRREIVQALPVVAPLKVPTTRTAVASIRAPLAPTTAAARPLVAWTPSKGNFYVQLGAFENAGVAKDAWGRLSHRISALGQYTPTGAKIASGGQNFYRLAVGGFARGDADALCRKVRVGGGRCFVRAGAGDAVAAWVKPAKAGVQLAMR